MPEPLLDSVLLQCVEVHGTQVSMMLDTKIGDWILVGERNLKASVLTLDDWVVALRARFIHGEEEPKVERLWQEPPPPLLSVLQEWGLV